MMVMNSPAKLKAPAGPEDDAIATLHAPSVMPQKQPVVLPPPAAAAAPKADPMAQQIATVRSMLGPQYVHSVDDATIKRFIVATNGNLQLSAKRLQATCAWREKTRPQEVVCKACAKDPRAHYMHIVGHDAVQRPIIYSCLAAAKNKVYADNHAHMIATFEQAVKLMPPGPQGGQWVWACDFHGFGMADVNPSLAKAFLDVSATHYPERLGLFLVIDAPSLFGMLWRAIQSFVDPKTYTKIRFLPFDLKLGAKSTLRATLAEFCPPDMVNWLCREMQENRDSKVLKAKRYDVYEMHRAALEHRLQPLPEPQHDCRGSPQLLSMFSQNPALMEPLAAQGHAAAAAPAGGGLGMFQTLSHNGHNSQVPHHHTEPQHHGFFSRHRRARSQDRY